MSTPIALASVASAALTTSYATLKDFAATPVEKLIIINTLDVDVYLAWNADASSTAHWVFLPAGVGMILDVDDVPPNGILKVRAVTAAGTTGSIYASGIAV